MSHIIVKIKISTILPKERKIHFALLRIYLFKEAIHYIHFFAILLLVSTQGMLQYSKYEYFKKYLYCERKY
jgi:hypothetical protein